MGLFDEIAKPDKDAAVKQIAKGFDVNESDLSDAFEKLVMDVLLDVAENGVPQEQLEAVLHQLELESGDAPGPDLGLGMPLPLAMALLRDAYTKAVSSLMSPCS